MLEQVGGKSEGLSNLQLVAAILGGVSVVFIFLGIIGGFRGGKRINQSNTGSSLVQHTKNAIMIKESGHGQGIPKNALTRDISEDHLYKEISPYATVQVGKTSSNIFWWIIHVYMYDLFRYLFFSVFSYKNQEKERWSILDLFTAELIKCWSQGLRLVIMETWEICRLSDCKRASRLEM